MDKIKEEITKLTEKWYNLIAPDHHKNRDCHWYINTKWSYGQDPVYVVEHFGYVYEHVEISCATYELALQALKKELELAIKQEEDYHDELKED
jgi:hypothetical protein